LVGAEKCSRSNGKLLARDAGTMTEMRYEDAAVAPARGAINAPESSVARASASWRRRFTPPAY